MTSPAHSPKPGISGTEPHEPIWGARMGWLLGADGEGLPLVDFDGNRAGPLVARKTLPLGPEVLRDAAAHPQRVVLMFENGDPRLPLIVGLEQPTSATPMLDALLTDAGTEPAAKPAQPDPSEASPVEAHVDGRRVVIEGADEVVLKCGEASITLRRNGKLILKGTYVESHSAGVNRIKGGSVQVN